MALSFKLSASHDSPYGDDGLEIRISLKTHFGSASGIDWRSLYDSFESVRQSGLGWVNRTALDWFQRSDFAALKDASRISSPHSVSVDLDALRRDVPELVERQWLPDEYGLRRTFLRNPEWCRETRGEVSLSASHFYNNSGDWGYHFYLSIWLAYDSAPTEKTPARVLYIFHNGDEDTSRRMETQIASPSKGKVFISYVKENATEVGRLVADLQVHGINVWLDRNSLEPGENWRDAIRNAIRSGSAFIACFSEHYTKRRKTYMNEELQIAIEEMRQMPRNRLWFIPVLLSPCEVPDYPIGPVERLADLQYVAVYEEWGKSIRRIAAAVNRAYEENEYRTTKRA